MDDRVEAYRRNVEEYYRRFAAGGFGKTRLAFYGAETEGLPDAVRDASLGCGNPVRHLLAAGPGRLRGRLLDLGCGGGMDLAISGTRGSFDLAVGIDRSAGMIGKCRETVARFPGAPLACLRADAERLPFADGCFDVILSNAAVNLVPDKARAFAECRRVLARDGAFFLADVCVLAPIPEETRRRFDVLDGLYFAPTLVPWEEEMRLLRRAFGVARTLVRVDILPDAEHAARLADGKRGLTPKERKFVRRGLMKGSFRVIEVECHPVARGTVDTAPCACGASVALETHQSVDVDASPGLLVALRDGRLNRFACPACGASGPLPAPVLVHSADLELRATLFPAAFRALAGDLLGRLPPGEIAAFSVDELLARLPALRARFDESAA